MVEMTRWLLGNLGAGYWGGLVEGGPVGKDYSEFMLQGLGRVLTGLALVTMGLHGYLASLINNNGDGLHGLTLHLHTQTNAAIGQNGLAALVALLASLQLGFLDRIGLLELIQLFRNSPEAAEVIKQ